MSTTKVEMLASLFEIAYSGVCVVNTDDINVIMNNARYIVIKRLNEHEVSLQHSNISHKPSDFKEGVVFGGKFKMEIDDVVNQIMTNNLQDRQIFKDIYQNPLIVKHKTTYETLMPLKHYPYFVTMQKDNVNTKMLMMYLINANNDVEYLLFNHTDSGIAPESPPVQLYGKSINGYYTNDYATVTSAIFSDIDVGVIKTTTNTPDMVLEYHNKLSGLVEVIIKAYAGKEFDEPQLANIVTKLKMYGAMRNTLNIINNKQTSLKG